MGIKQVENTIEIKQVGIKEIFPYAKNPRKNDTAVDAVAKSIEEFGFRQPIVVDKDMVIICGHTRWKAAKKLKLKTIPIHIAAELTDEQARAYRLADNKTNELAEWDINLLNDELVGLEDFEMGGFGFEGLGLGGDGSAVEEDKYTKKVDVPQYEITGEKPEIKDLFDRKKTDDLIKEIEQSGVSEEDKVFLINAAYRHICFDYHNIAEYYAHANKELQELMERSALVIIDFNNAIRDGYVKFSQLVDELIEEEAKE